MSGNEEKQRKAWQSFSNCVCLYQTKYSPASWKIFKYREGWYLLLRFVILSVCTVAASGAQTLWNLLPGLLATYFLFDILTYNTSVAFVTKKPISGLRSFLLTFFAFTHIIIIFAVFYRFLEHQFIGKLCTTQALYFSTMTIATVGYGDIVPRLSGTTTQAVVIVEVLTGFFFATGIFARVIGFQGKPGQRKAPSNE